MKNSINQNKFKHILSIEAIYDIIFQFHEKDVILNLSILSKIINQIFYNQIKELKISSYDKNILKCKN